MRDVEDEGPVLFMIRYLLSSILCALVSGGGKIRAYTLPPVTRIHFLGTTKDVNGSNL